MKQEIVFSGQADAESAVQELVRKLNNPPESYNAVLFFASSDYDFEILSTLLHEKFSGAQVVGTTTSGEISKQGIHEPFNSSDRAFLRQNKIFRRCVRRS